MIFQGVIYRLGYLTHVKKNASRKVFEILFWLETSKKCPLQKGSGMRAEVTLSSSQCAILLPKNSFYFQNSTVIFQNCSFISKKCLFTSQKSYTVVQNCPLVLLRAAQRYNIYLAFVLFPLRTIYWSTYYPLSLACVHIQIISKLHPE